MNRILVIVCFAVLLCGQGFSQNNQMNRLFIEASLLLIIRYSYKIKLEIHHYLFFAWLAWCALGVWCSDYPDLAWQGYYPYRGQGLLTYIVLTALGVIYWKTFTSIKPLSWFCVVACIATASYHYLTVPLWDDGDGYQVLMQNRFASIFLPDVAISSFACLCGILAMQIHPALVCVAIFPILNSGSRSATMAMTLAGLLCVFLIRKEIKFNLPFKLSKFSKWGLSAIAGILLFSLICEKAYYFEQRIRTLPKLSQLGQGARSQWVKEGIQLSQSLPLTGFGLDTLSNYLYTPKMKGYEGLQAYIPDKTHFLAMDIILQTGWIGFGLLLFTLIFAARTAYYSSCKENWICLCTLLAYVLFTMINPAGALTDCVAITALFGIRKIE